jgi:hypothetical protein
MGLFCSLPYSCPSHFHAHYEGLDNVDDDYGREKLIRHAKLKMSQNPKRDIHGRNPPASATGRSPPSGILSLDDAPEYIHEGGYGRVRPFIAQGRAFLIHLHT